MPAATRATQNHNKEEEEKLRLRQQIEEALHAYLQAGRAIEQVPQRVAPEVPPLARHGSMLPEDSL